MLTASQLVEYCKKQVNVKSVYMWGSFGQTVTKDFVNQKKKQYPAKYTANMVTYLSQFYGKNVRAWDCVGLIKSAVWNDYRTGNTKDYKAAQDIGADYAYNISKVKGDISTLPEVPGIILHMAGHVGVYIGNGEVIESTPAWKNGVQKTKLSQRKWKHWFQFPYVEYPVENVDKSIDPNKRYNSLNEIPAGEFREVVKTLADRGIVKGSAGGLDLSGDMVRMLVYLHRAGVL